MKRTNLRSHSRYKFTIGEREIKILSVVSHGKLRVMHIVKILGYSTRSVELLQTVVRRLVQGRYLARERQENRTGIGSSAYLYSVSRHGWKWLRRQGLVDQERFRSRLGLELDPHSAMVRETLVNALCLPCFDQRIHIDQVQTESELRGLGLRALVVQDERTGKVGYRHLCPDLFLRFSHYAGDRHIQTAIWVECELTKLRFRSSWFKKLETLVSFLETDYPKHFGTFFPIVAVTVADPHRLPILKRWTEEFLTERGAKWGRLFLFSSASPETTPPLHFWTSPIWVQAYQEEATPLLDMKSGMIRTVRHNLGIRTN